MASFEGKEIDQLRLDETYIHESSKKELMDYLNKLLNESDGEESITYITSCISVINSLLEENTPIVKIPSNTEEIIILNNIETESTANKGEPEKMQIQFNHQWTQSHRNIKTKINMEDKYYTDQVQSASCQDMDVNNVFTNYAIPSTSNDSKILESPANKTQSTSVTCTVCGSVLSRKANLLYHLASKHGIGEYKCDACKLVFIYSSLLNRHNIKYHKKGYFVCCFCRNEFEDMKDLTDHTNVFHRRRECRPSCCNCKHNSRLNMCDKILQSVCGQ